MEPTLTQDFCRTVYESADASGIDNPILQILNVKRINATAPSAVDRYRVILSDGQHFIQSMLATQLNGMVESKELDKNVVVRLSSYVTNAVQGRKLVIILGCEVIPYQGEKIGDPKNVEQAVAAGGAGGAGGAAAPPPVSAATAARANGAANGRGGAAAPRGGRQGGASAAAMGPLFPIEGLSPYSNRWTIKARVTTKGDIKTWSNARGEGKLFNVTFMDETGEIQATGFNSEVDSLYDRLEEGKVYFVSKARVNIAKKQFSNVNNEYQITFERDTEIEPCDDDSVPQVKYNFRHISDLEAEPKDAIIDVIGIVKDAGELGSITSKATQKAVPKREITLVDSTAHSVRLTLWGKQAETFNYIDEPVIAFKGVKVSDFSGRSLSMFSGATMSVNPDISEAHALRGWYDSRGRMATYKAYNNSSVMRDGATGARPADPEKTIGDAKDEQLGMGDKTDYFTTSATIGFVKSETYAYPACPNPDGCNKKVVEDHDGWMCEKCDKKWPQPVYRYILQMNVFDHTNSFWITAFNEVAEQIMGISANDLTALKDESQGKFQAYFQKTHSKTFQFQMMAKQDQFNDQIRVRYQCRRANTIDYPSNSATLAQQIESLSQSLGLM